MRNVIVAFAVGMAAISAGSRLDRPQYAHANESQTDAPQSREPAVNVEDAVTLSKEFMKKRELGKQWYVRSMQYQSQGDWGPCWMIVLNDKFDAIESEPLLIVKMDRSVELIPGE